MNDSGFKVLGCGFNISSRLRLNNSKTTIPHISQVEVAADTLST
jgi:hypothetical protein